MLSPPCKFSGQIPIPALPTIRLGIIRTLHSYRPVLALVKPSVHCPSVPLPRVQVLAVFRFGSTTLPILWVICVSVDLLGLVGGSRPVLCASSSLPHFVSTMCLLVGLNGFWVLPMFFLLGCNPTRGVVAYWSPFTFTFTPS